MDSNFAWAVFCDAATAAAIVAACANARHRISPELVEIGDYAGQYVIPAAVRNNLAIPQAARDLVPTDEPVLIDFTTLWPEVYEHITWTHVASAILRVCMLTLCVLCARHDCVCPSS
jgi:hypothetical protein